jgi:predicted DNA-binding transcriptional regulator YafY
MEGYHLPPVLFTEDEANALITVEQLVIKNKDQSFSEDVSSAIEKIKSILRYSHKGNADSIGYYPFSDLKNGIPFFRKKASYPKH